MSQSIVGPIRREGTELAPPGTVYVCDHCKRRAKTRFGFDANSNDTVLDPGWDENCISYMVLRDAVSGKKIE